MHGTRHSGIFHSEEAKSEMSSPHEIGKTWGFPHPGYGELSYRDANTLSLLVGKQTPIAISTGKLYSIHQNADPIMGVLLNGRVLAGQA